MNMCAMHTTAAALFALSTFAAAAQDPAWVADARKVAGSVPPKLIAVLNDEIAKGGPEGAIAVCRDKAPELAKAASAESGWAIRRVSLKNRNPKAVPDAWERAALEDFDRRAAGGESPATIEKAGVVVVDGKETYRYMKALPVQPLCVTCHGSADQLSPVLKEKLKAVYPDDKGVGYSPGQIRGAITLKKPV
jgi:hypothetical protein